MGHPSFGARSRACLDTCDPRLVTLAECALKVGMDFAVLHGYRGQHLQDELYAQGFSQKRYPDSRHNTTTAQGTPCSCAIDVAPYPIDWDDRWRFYHLAGIFRAVAFDLAIGIRWGGDWDGDYDLSDNTFMDLGHIEILE